ncbi:hypothetical protein WS55_20905 [Burkholderia pseudomultivorans]|nr:hypothetical protein WS55_20905 [Burkholderia pseudomultivorans]KVC33461.1 hypothetical protein WS56_00570 [Burkholderia pseudomultivorans]
MLLYMDGYDICEDYFASGVLNMDNCQVDASIKSSTFKACGYGRGRPQGMPLRSQLKWLYLRIQCARFGCLFAKIFYDEFSL